VHSADPEHFQPMNANFGLLEPLERPVKDKQKKKALLAERAMADIERFAKRIGIPRGVAPGSAAPGPAAGPAAPGPQPCAADPGPAARGNVS